MYAIKINNEHWFSDHYRDNRVLLFTTEKKALKEIEFIKKDPKWFTIDLKVVEVEVETNIDFEKCISTQTVREL